MVAEILGTFPSSIEAENAVVRIKTAGVRASEVVVVDPASEVDLMLSTKRGIGWGAALGALMGVALVAYSDSTGFSHSGGIISIPLIGAFGWGLYGAIVGGGGVLAGQAKKGPTVLAVSLPSTGELDTVSNALYEAGASNVRTFEDIAA